jgi:hypothetical protein
LFALASESIFVQGQSLPCAFEIAQEAMFEAADRLLPYRIEAIDRHNTEFYPELLLIQLRKAAVLFERVMAAAKAVQQAYSLSNV